MAAVSDLGRIPIGSRNVEAVGVFFIALGVLFLLLVVGFAFTPYAYVAGLLGVISISVGVWMLARRSTQATNGQ